MSRRNKNVYSPMEQILVATGNQALATATASLVGSGSALNILSGQLGILSADHKGSETFGKFITAGRTALQVASVQVVQGTPKSGSINTVNAYGVGDPAFVASAIIDADKVNYVATYKYIPGKHAIKRVQVSTPVVSTEYTAFINLRSHRGDRDFGKMPDTLIASIVTPSTAPTDIKDLVLQTLAYKFNLQASFTNGNRPIAVLGMKRSGSGSGVNIGGLTAGTSVPVVVVNGVTYSLTFTTEMIASLQDAIVIDAGLATADIELIDLSTAGAAAKIDELLVIGLDEPRALAFDNINQTKVAVRWSTKTGLTSTVTSLSEPADTVNDGANWQLRYNERRGVTAFTLQNHPFNEYFISPTDYVDTAVNYTATIIEFYGNESTISGEMKSPKTVVILLPCAISNPTADASTPYTIATTATTTVTALNASLGAWLSSASDEYSRIQYLGSATKAAPFV